jgi:uncharacterized protein (DUF433 family)
LENFPANVEALHAAEVKLTEWCFPAMISERAAETRTDLQDVVWKDPERAGDKLCFRGTRVAVQALIDYLDEGHSVDRFLESFPTVSRAQATRFLHLAATTAGRLTPEEGQRKARDRSPQARL